MRTMREELVCDLNPYKGTKAGDFELNFPAIYSDKDGRGGGTPGRAAFAGILLFMGLEDNKDFQLVNQNQAVGWNTGVMLIGPHNTIIGLATVLNLNSPKPIFGLKYTGQTNASEVWLSRLNNLIGKLMNDQAFNIASNPALNNTVVKALDIAYDRLLKDMKTAGLTVNEQMFEKRGESLLQHRFYQLYSTLCRHHEQLLAKYRADHPIASTWKMNQHPYEKLEKVIGQHSDLIPDRFVRQGEEYFARRIKLDEFEKVVNPVPVKVGVQLK